MKKVVYSILIIFIASITFILAYGYKNNLNPKNYYKVYLNNEILGIIDSEDLLNKFIDKQSENVKKKYKVSQVYSPVGLQVKKLSSYEENVISVDDVFNKIMEKSSLTVEGYQITIKNDTSSSTINVINDKLFEKATEDFIKTFVGSDKYNQYKTKNQKPILETGTTVENIYIQNDITIKKAKLSIDEKIYVDEKELSQYLLFGANVESKKYTVKLGDTIAKVAFANEISTEEFLISNPQFTDKNNLLHVGQEVTIAVTNPQMKVVLEEYQVVDKEETYSVEERYDSTQYVGYEEIVQKGENGILRVSQNVQIINGSIAYIDPIEKKEMKPSISKIVIKGDKYVPSIGDLKNWAWPSNQGYTITDDFEWRTNPITGKREHHSGIDISGTGYGSPVYAANNGTIITKKYSADYGYFIVINHNNGYWTVYAHMSRFAKVNIGDVVMRGQVIGYVGSTGWSTGPHLHFEVWKNCEHCRINPFLLYR